MKFLLWLRQKKKKYFHNILDAIKGPQVIWSIPCDHNDSLHEIWWGAEKGNHWQKTSWMFSILLATPKNNFAGPAFLALFFWEGEQQDITFQEAKWSSFVPIFFCVVLQDCALGSSNRCAMNAQEMDWVLLGLFCFVMMLLYTSLDSTNNTVLANLLWLSQVCLHWMLLCVWNHKLSSLIWRHSSL